LIVFLCFSIVDLPKEAVMFNIAVVDDDQDIHQYLEKMISIFIH